MALLIGDDEPLVDTLSTLKSQLKKIAIDYPLLKDTHDGRLLIHGVFKLTIKEELFFVVRALPAAKNNSVDHEKARWLSYDLMAKLLENSGTTADENEFPDGFGYLPFVF